MIRLVTRPRQVTSWDLFLMTSPPCSIALDGYVYGRPQYNARTFAINFNHHEDVDRLSTRSTAAQVFMYIKQGLMQKFRAAEHAVSVYVNDCDHDVCMAVWLLRHYPRISGTNSEPLISRLVWGVDMLDATGGLHPMQPDSDLLQDMAWIFRPYSEARAAGRIDSLNATDIESIIDAVCARIDAYTVGQGKKVALDTRYDVLHRGNGWALIREIGTEARRGVLADGLEGFVALKGEFITDGTKRFSYSICRTAIFNSFVIDYATLNAAEGIADESLDRWGGSNMNGGSPRASGSRLSPEQLVQVIEKQNGENQ